MFCSLDRDGNGVLSVEEAGVTFCMHMAASASATLEVRTRPLGFCYFCFDPPQVQQGFCNLCHADSPEMHPGHVWLAHMHLAVPHAPSRVPMESRSCKARFAEDRADA